MRPYESVESEDFTEGREWWNGKKSLQLVSGSALSSSNVSKNVLEKLNSWTERRGTIGICVYGNFKRYDLDKGYDSLSTRFQAKWALQTQSNTSIFSWLMNAALNFYSVYKRLFPQTRAFVSHYERTKKQNWWVIIENLPYSSRTGTISTVLTLPRRQMCS